MSIAWLIALKLAGIGILYLALAAALVRRFAARSPAPSGPSQSVTILKPLHGAEPGLYENLTSFCFQDYGGAVQIVLGVQDRSDPAIGIVRDLQAAFPDREIELVVDGRQHGANRKVSNLVNMSGEIRHDLVVLADSDMRVGPDYLGHLAAELGRPGVGAVTCLYHGVPVGNVWSRLSALSIDTHFTPGVIMGLALGLAKPCFGSTIALRRETLARVGGFAAFADVLADDYEIGAAVRRLGLSVSVPNISIGHVCPERTFAELGAQELRWARTIRQIEPAGHLGSIVSHPLAFALLAFALGPGPIAAAFVVTAIAVRFWLCLAVERAFGLKPHGYWLVPARDLLSLGVFILSFFGRRVSWRGHRYDVARSGALLPQTRADPT